MGAAGFADVLGNRMRLQVGFADAKSRLFYNFTRLRSLQVRPFLLTIKNRANALLFLVGAAGFEPAKNMIYRYTRIAVRDFVKPHVFFLCAFAVSPRPHDKTVFSCKNILHYPLRIINNFL